MILFRRLLVLATFAFWQGGFTFYAAVVVPIGAEVLGGPAEQGRITRPVTWYMNLSGAVALAVFFADVAAVKSLRRTRAAVLLAECLLLLALVLLRAHLEGMIERDGVFPVDRSAFRPLHRTYLWISSVQWAFGVAFLVLTLAAWRGTDRVFGQASPEVVRHG